MFCPNCGQEVNGKFCTNCGTQMLLDEEVTLETKAADPAPAFQAIPDPVIEPAAQEAAPQEAASFIPQQVEAAPAQAAFTPAATAAPAPKPKKKMGAGKIILIVLLSILGLIILSFAGCVACALIVGDDTSGTATVEPADVPVLVDEDDDLPEIAEVKDDLDQEPSPFADLEGYLVLSVDDAAYDGENIVANVTLWNDCEFGIDYIRDMMVSIYTEDDEFVAYGNFFFDEPYHEGIIAPGDYAEMELTFTPEDGRVAADMDLDNLDNPPLFELMCRMYDEDENLIGGRIEAAPFAVCIPNEWVDTVDYYTSDDDGSTSYTFYNVANARANFGGILFSIACYDLDAELPDDENYVLLDKDAYYQYVLVTPSDVQYDASNPTLANEYQTQAAQIQTVLDSLNLY